MRRRPLFMAAVLAGVVSASVAMADYQQDIVRQLQGMGFSRVEVTRTLLGRVRITADGADGTREIILNPNTGEILRDLWLRQDGRAPDRALLDGSDRDDRQNGEVSGNSGSSGSANDDDDDDDDDNSGGRSGSNSGSSGNSGSNSGSGSDDRDDDGGDDGDDGGDDD